MLRQGRLPLLVCALLVACCRAQSGALGFTVIFSTIAIGSPVLITWQGGSPSAGYSLFLVQGSPTNLVTVGTIVSNINANSFTWTPPTSLTPGNDYALKIGSGTLVNYSDQFSIVAGTASSPKSTTPSSTAAQPPSTQLLPSPTSTSASVTSSTTAHPTQGSGSYATKTGTVSPTPPQTSNLAKAGSVILTGSCAVPTFTSLTNPNILYVWLGCSNDQPSCCAFPLPSFGNSTSETGIPLNYGELTNCPADYTTTSRACCPSGWSIYTTLLGARTPCFTAPPIPLLLPTSLIASASATAVFATIILDKLFTLQYPLHSAPPPPAQTGGLSTAAKAGIGAGVAVGVILAVLAVGYVVVARRRRSRRGEGGAPSHGSKEEYASQPAVAELDPQQQRGRRVELETTMQQTREGVVHELRRGEEDGQLVELGTG